MSRTAASDTAEYRDDDEKHQHYDSELVVVNVSNGYNNDQNHIIRSESVEFVKCEELHIPRDEETEGEQMIQYINDLTTA